MDSLSPVQQIDVVLNIFKNDRGHMSFDDLYNKTKAEIDGDILSRIIEKLIRDKYIYISVVQSANFEKYSITFEGFLFDGYETKALNDAADALQQRLEINRLKTVDAHADANQIRLNRLTLYLAIGTGALALIEIVKFFVWIFSPTKSL